MVDDPRRRLPSVDALLATAPFAALLARHPRERVLTRLRERLDEARAGLAGSFEPDAPARPEGWAVDLAADVATRLEADDAVSLRSVVNATGVVLHTNLGRAPLAEAARAAMADAARGYSNLEYDLDTGARGSRYDHCASLLVELTGAEGALVVNNAAAGLVLALNTVARGRGVVVSRGELVEIGGGFRIPEILERSGVTLVEVGSTNRTRPADYAAALLEHDVGAVLKVHRSNFRMRGFTEEAGVEDLAALAAGAGLPLLYDLGSGLLADPAALGLPPEPRPQDALRSGADLVVVSGDKLLGGPQAGLVLGGGELVAAMRANPLCRALRVDKVTLAGLEATLRLYLDPDRALSAVPTLRMLSLSEEDVHKRADALAGRLEGVEGVAVERVSGAVGGGTYPDVELPSWAVVLRGGSPSALARALRRGDPPVIGRIDDDGLVLDVRTVGERELGAVARRVREALRSLGA